MSVLVTEVLERTLRSKDDIEHLFCDCTPGVGLCGHDLAGEPVCLGNCEHEECPTCVDLAEVRCVICGCGIEPECFECVAANP